MLPVCPCSMPRPISGLGRLQGRVRQGLENWRGLPGRARCQVVFFQGLHRGHAFKYCRTFNSAGGTLARPKG